MCTASMRAPSWSASTSRVEPSRDGRSSTTRRRSSRRRARRARARTREHRPHGVPGRDPLQSPEEVARIAGVAERARGRPGCGPMPEAEVGPRRSRSVLRTDEVDEAARRLGRDEPHADAVADVEARFALDDAALRRRIGAGARRSPLRRRAGDDGVERRRRCARAGSAPPRPCASCARTCARASSRSVQCARDLARARRRVYGAASPSRRRLQQPLRDEIADSAGSARSSARSRRPRGRSGPVGSSRAICEHVLARTEQLHDRQREVGEGVGSASCGARAGTSESATASGSAGSSAPSARRERRRCGPSASACGRRAGSTRSARSSRKRAVTPFAAIMRSSMSSRARFL